MKNIEELVRAVRPVDRGLAESLQAKIDQKTKPFGALGRLESLALQIGLIQQTLAPELRQPRIIVFAGDHGIAATGRVNPFPQEVTAQMVLNFLAGGAAINSFTRLHGLDLEVVDAGVAADLPEHPQLVNAKIRKGTRNYLDEPAMTMAECQAAMMAGAERVNVAADEGCNVIGFGEMGIGNSSAASLILHRLGGVALEEVVGAGTGLDPEGIGRKLDALTEAADTHAGITDPLEVLATFGGYEIAMICGAMLAAADRRMLILVDGFIVSAAWLVAWKLASALNDYSVFCHQSAERGHRHLLQLCGQEPLLDLGMRLGEGTGAAVAWPVVVSAVAFLRDMSSFADAGVSEADDS